MGGYEKYAESVVM